YERVLRDASKRRVLAQRDSRHLAELDRPDAGVTPRRGQMRGRARQGRGDAEACERESPSPPRRFDRPKPREGQQLSTHSGLGLSEAAAEARAAARVAEARAEARTAAAAAEPLAAGGAAGAAEPGLVRRAVAAAVPLAAMPGAAMPAARAA